MSPPSRWSDWSNHVLAEVKRQSDNYEYQSRELTQLNAICEHQGKELTRLNENYERQSTKLNDLLNKFNDLNIELKTFKVRAGFYGSLSGAATTVLVFLGKWLINK